MGHFPEKWNQAHDGSFHVCASQFCARFKVMHNLNFSFPVLQLTKVRRVQTELKPKTDSQQTAKIFLWQSFR